MSGRHLKYGPRKGGFQNERLNAPRRETYAVLDMNSGEVEKACDPSMHARRCIRSAGNKISAAGAKRKPFLS